jgi:hypothetical protein
MRTSARPYFTNALSTLLEGQEARHTPDDSVDCKYLSRAYHELARVIYPDWTGTELGLTLPVLLPDAIEPCNALLFGGQDEKTTPAEWYETPQRAVLEYALELLNTYRPDVRSKPHAAGFAMGLSIASPRFTLHEWKVAQGINRADFERIKADLQKKRSVDKVICRLCEAGILLTRLRDPEGGEFSNVLPTSWWRTENYGERFRTWRMHPQRPFSTQCDLHCIFVDRASLAVALMRLKGGYNIESDAVLSTFVSDQILFLLEIATKCRVTADDPASVEAIKARIVQDWPWAGRPGKTELRYMASFVRNRSARDQPWTNKKRKA